MELKDFIVTPLVFLIILVAGYLIRPYVSNQHTRRYFFPALIFRMVAAILLGFLYQFYYDSGDTFLYHTRGSAIIYETLLDRPLEGIELFFSDGDPTQHRHSVISRIRYFGDKSSFKIVQIATLFDLLTFATYSATALFFALLSFSGCWALYKVFYSYFPQINRKIAIAFLFIPSVIFWGSGLLKDSITLMAFGWLVYSFDQLIIKRRWKIISIFMFGLAVYLLYSIKLYILLAVFPTLMIWFYATNISSINNVILKWLIAPLLITGSLAVTVYIINTATEENQKYSLGQISKTAMITAHDIAYWTGKDAGSTYVLGELDGSLESLIRLFPQAVNVTFFRPYLWEINNILMLLSSVESTLILLIFIYILIQSKFVNLFSIKWPPIILFALSFSIIFGFAVGVSTFNFGTLSRYKIPCMPLFVITLIYIHSQLSNRSKPDTSLEYIS